MLSLRNSVVSLRAPEPQDLDILYSWENDTSVWHISNTPSPFSKNTLRQYLESVQDIYANRQLRFIIEDDKNLPVGCIDLYDYEPLHSKVGIGILIAQENRNKGLGREALNILIPYAFNHLRLNQIYCTITTSNTKSVRLFENQGFRKSGTLKCWISSVSGYEDAHVFQLLKTDLLYETS